MRKLTRVYAENKNAEWISSNILHKKKCLQIQTFQTLNIAPKVANVFFLSDISAKEDWCVRFWKQSQNQA